MTATPASRPQKTYERSGKAICDRHHTSVESLEGRDRRSIAPRCGRKSPSGLQTFFRFPYPLNQQTLCLPANPAGPLADFVAER